jgi:hypothetical protein
MMHKKLNSSAEYSKKITPCTTVPTSPNSESISIDPCWNPKWRLIKSYEFKTFSLFEHIGKIVIDLNQRLALIQRKTEKKQKKSRSLQNIRSVSLKNAKIETNPDLNDDLNAINLDLLRRVERLELRNNAEQRELKEMQEKVNEGSLIHQFANKTISDINRSLVKLYGTKDEKLKILQFMQVETKKALETKKLVKNALSTLNQQKNLFTKKKNFIEQKKSTILENQTKIEDLKIKNFKTKFSNDRLLNRSNELNLVVSQLSQQHQKVVERVKQKILNIETSAEKIQMQEKISRLRKEKISKESKKIFERSREIFELLKLLEGKNIEMDQEMQEIENRTKGLKDKILGVRENKEFHDVNLVQSDLL